MTEASTRRAVPTTWRSEVEHRRALADRLNSFNTSSFVQRGEITDLTTDSPTSVTFTGVPDWAETVELVVIGASLSNTDELNFRVGDASGIATTGYSGSTDNADGTLDLTNSTSHRVMNMNAGTTAHGTVMCRHTGSNVWLIESIFVRNVSIAYNISATTITLSNPLVQVQFLASGTDTFDAGNAVMRYY